MVGVPPLLCARLANRTTRSPGAWCGRHSYKRQRASTHPLGDLFILSTQVGPLVCFYRHPYSIMDQTPAPTTHTNTDTDIATPTPPRLFNDVHFQRSEPQGPRHAASWAPFARLPPELRRYLWLACLRRHRMIDLDICAADEDAAVHSRHGSQYYSHRNALGNIVSGRDYVLSWSGDRQGPAGAYSPLLWVSREARRAALAFYRVQLPFFGLQRDRVLYLNPAYDVISIQPQWESGRAVSHIMLADLLHDIKAYDRKGQGYVYEQVLSSRIGS